METVVLHFDDMGRKILSNNLRLTEEDINFFIKEEDELESLCLVLPSQIIVDEDGDYHPQPYNEDDNFEYCTRNFKVTVEFHSSSDEVYTWRFWRPEAILRWTPKNSKGKRIIQDAKRKIHREHINALYEEAKRLGYDPRTAEIAVHTHYSLESRVAQTVNDVLNGNTNFRPFVSKNHWHNISNKSFEMWFEVVTGKKAPELTGPRWYSVYTLVQDVLGQIEVDEGTAARWATK